MSNQLKKNAVFGVVAAVILAGAIFAVTYADLFILLLPFIFIVGLLALLFAKYDVLVKLTDYERAVVFRLGRLNRVTGPGWFLMVPGLEEHTTVDLRVQTIDIPTQEVITKGKIEVVIDAVIYMKISKALESIVKSVVSVEDYKKAAQLYVAASLRDVVGDLTLSDLISNVESLNMQLKSKLQTVSDDWGVQVDAVEIKDINIPKTVMDAMHEQKASEQRKLARMEEAKAHQAEIEAVKLASSGLDEKAIAYYYIRALEKMGDGKATKIIFPVELSRLASLMTGKLQPSLAPPSTPQQDQLPVPDLILKNKKAIEQLVGKDLADSLEKVILEEKGKKVVEATA
jgi:regulator of protease activity HflC (stomatin/prohibitin superfamily)